MRLKLIGCYLTFCMINFALFISCKKQSTDSIAHQQVSEIEKALSDTISSNYGTLPTSYVSLNNALKLAQKIKNDTLICKALLSLGANLRLQGKIDEALNHFQRADQLSQSINFFRGLCQAIIETGSIYYIQGQYDKSFELFNDALAIAQKNSFFDLEAKSLNHIGKYYHTTGRYQESVEFYKKAIDTYSKKGDLIQSSTALLSLGKTYYYEGNFYLALKCYLDALKACERTNDRATLADICNHLGSIYLALNYPDRAMEYHRKSLAYRQELHSPESMASSFNNIGKVFLAKNNTDSAIVYFQKALKSSEQISYSKGLVKALTNIGKVYNIISNPRTAKKHLIKSLEIASQAGYDAGVAEASLELGNAYLNINESDSALLFYNICLEKAKSANLSDLNHNGYWGIYQCYINKKDYKSAIEFYRRYYQAEKNILQAENNYQLSELRVNFESESKEKANEVLRKENELKEMTILRKNTLMWLVIIALAFSLVFIFMLYLRFESKRKANKRLELLNNQIVKQNVELEKLNKELENANREKDKIFSIIGHELRNPLYWFQNLTEMLSLRYITMPTEKVQKSLISLDESAKNAFHLMDNLLHWSRSRLNRITPRITGQSLEKLITESTRMYETILQYKGIQLNTRLPKDSYIKVDPDLFTCVVRNLISNAIKYTPENGEIEITCEPEKENFIISVSDSGIGIQQKNMTAIFDTNSDYSTSGLMNEKGSGLGLKLCKEFVEMNGGRIWISNNQLKGTNFSFTVLAWNEIVN